MQIVYFGNTLINDVMLGSQRMDDVILKPPVVATIRPDAYSAFIAYAQPMNYFSGSFGMTNFDSDIHASIKGSGNNYIFPASGSGTYQATAGKTAFASDGYVTSLRLSGDQNAGAWGTATAPTDLQMGSSDFVWEAYVNTDATIINNGIAMLRGYPNTGNWSFSQNPAYIRMLVGPGDFFQDSVSTLPKTADVWRHWAFVRSGNNFYCYWDGTRVINFSSTLTIGLNNPVQLLGQASGDSSQTVQFQDFRIYKGTDKGYTGSTITPPPSMVVYS